MKNIRKHNFFTLRLQLNNKMFLKESIVDLRYEFLLNKSQKVTAKKKILFHI